MLVPIMMFGWIPLTIIFFLLLPPRTAVLCAVIGGVLFLPMATYDLPGIPKYTKNTAIAVGLLFGTFLSGARTENPLQWKSFDIPMLLWCFFCPLATSFFNNLGLYDGISGVVQFYLLWGVFYWTGRRYFTDSRSLHDLCLGMIIGGLIYVPLCIYELRMSPQLSNIFYGFFPHIWSQHFRYGGYRPVVFMQHGLMVALWMSLTFMVSFWLWRAKRIVHLKGIPMFLAVFALFVIAILCKSVNGWFFLILGIAAYMYFAIFKSTRLYRLLILFIPLYILVRMTNILPMQYLQDKASIFLDENRVTSLTSRLVQENLFSAKSLEHPLFGWGGWNRGWPIDPDTGEKILHSVDSLWVIIFNSYGFAGLTCLFLAMLISPWLVLKKKNQNSKCADTLPGVYPTVLALVVVFFMLDSLFNGMVNPVYILCSGALLGFHLANTKKSDNSTPSLETKIVNGR